MKTIQIEIIKDIDTYYCNTSIDGEWVLYKSIEDYVPYRTLKKQIENTLMGVKLPLLRELKFTPFGRKERAVFTATVKL